jgi:hypothetical protein
MAERDKIGAEPVKAIVIGLFPDPETAAEAIRQLKAEGFTNDEIGAILRKRGSKGELLDEVVEGEDLDVEAEAVKTGATTGGVIGGVFGLLGSLLIPGLGPITLGGVLATTLLGAGAGVVTGGLMGLLVGMGLSRTEAEYFDRGVREGGVLVTVQPEVPARTADARSTLRNAGAGLGPGALTSESAAVGGREEHEPWRGNERRYHQDTGFAGPERRKAHAGR